MKEGLSNKKGCPRARVRKYTNTIWSNPLLFPICPQGSRWGKTSIGA